jgi:hypothetical protein
MKYFKNLRSHNMETLEENDIFLEAEYLLNLKQEDVKALTQI